MKISIISAYHNRRDLLILTLNSIIRSKQTDYEFIVVDDASSPEHRLEDLQEIYPFLKVLRIEKKDKNWVNPCIPFNMAIAKAKGDIVILQNPECLHIGDVLSYIVDNLNESNYIAMPTYALDRTSTNILRYKKQEDIPHFVGSLPQQTFKNGTGWYNHSKHRPVYYHFCAAITQNNLRKLGGFDERFAPGIAYDDNELVERVKRLGLNLVIPDSNSIFVIHQNHDKLHYPLRKEYVSLVKRNEELFNQVKKEKTIKVFNRYE